MNKLSVIEQYQIKSLLNRTIQSRDNFEKNSNINGKHFNIFNILCLGNKEVETHSKFIYELLSVKGRHDCGNTYQSLFIKNVLNINTSAKFNVYRELTINSGRRIDFVLESCEHIVGIEMKIYADDQDEQLIDYYKELNRRANNREVKLYYLTLTGKSATYKSLKDLSDCQYHRISFKEHIYNWLDLCIQVAAKKNILREALIQYQLLIEHLTLKDTEFTVELASSLIHNKEDLAAAFEISESLHLTRIKLLENFWNALYIQLHSKFDDIKFINGKSVKSMSVNYVKCKNNSKNIGFKYPVTNYQDKKIWVYISLYNVITYGLRIEDKYGNLEKDNVLKTLCQQNLQQGNAVANSHEDWLIAYYYYQDTDQVLYFNPNKLSSKEIIETAQLISDSKKLDDVIKKIIHHLQIIESHFKTLIV